MNNPALESDNESNTIKMVNSWRSAIIGTEGERVLGYFMKKMEPNVSTKALTVMIRALASIETGLKYRNKLIACSPLLIYFLEVF